MFKDRIDAGRQLAKRLVSYSGRDAVVLAIPRGGVVLGHIIAQELRLPFDIVVTRKVGHPDNPEYAICAVDERGTLLCNETETQSVDKKWLREETERQKKEAQRRSSMYRGDKRPMELAGKTVIITDDGVATGLTMRLAIAAVRAQYPKYIVVAIPVAPSDVAQKIKQEADELVVLESPEDFLGSVGAHYKRFEQVKDEEVTHLMA
ncbi:MAG: phosphoribosyltransferase family protein [Minisyncoccia bacterium]